jgi:hypothetical protein
MAGGAALSVMRFAEGSWLGACRTQAFEVPTRVRLSFSGLEGRHEIVTYDDTNCRKPLSTWTRRFAIDRVHVFDEAKDAPEGLDLYVHIEQVSMLPVNNYADSANAGRLCGLTGWKDGKSQDVSGLDCGAGRIETEGSSPMLYIQDDSERAILFGNDRLVPETSP